MTYRSSGFRLTTLAASIALLCACGQKLSSADRAAIRTLSVDRNVAIATEPFYQGPAQAWAAPFGIVGAAISVAAAQTPAATIKASFAKNRVDLGTLAADEFRKQVTEARVFPQVTDDAGDYRVRLEITSWGLAQQGVFGGKYYPVLMVTARMYRQDGMQVWERQAGVNQVLGETVGGDFEEIMAKPDLMHAIFARASSLVVQALVTDLRGV